MRRQLAVAALISTAALVGSAEAKPWSWQARGSYVHDVATSPDGSVATYADRRLVQFTRDGKLRAERSLGGDALVKALAFAPDGELLVGGWFQHTIDLGGKQLTAQDRDGFIARYRPDGSLRWAVQVTAKNLAYVQAVAASADRVIAVGRTWGKGKVGARPLDGDRGLEVVLDRDGKVLAATQIDLGLEGELLAACATRDGFVVGGRDRPRGGDAGVVRGLTKDGALRWAHKAPLGRVEDLACRPDGTSFVASYGQVSPPQGNFSDDVAIEQLDPAGKLVRTIAIATPETDQPLSIAASATELVVTSRRTDHQAPSASRISRFAADGKPLASEELRDPTAAIWVRAAYRGDQLILAGELERGAKATIRGHDLVGPVVFVIAP